MGNFLLTGGHGFVGHQLVKSLVAMKHRVVLLVRPESNLDLIQGMPDLRYVYYDDLDHCMGDAKFSAMIHLATNYGRSSQKKIIDDNIKLGYDLLNLCIKHKVAYFINTDTCVDAKYSLYAATKKSFLEILKYYGANTNLSVANVQLQHVFGNGDRSMSFVASALDKIRNNVDVDATFGEQKRDFVYIKDVVSAYLAVVENPEPGISSIRSWIW